MGAFHGVAGGGGWGVEGGEAGWGGATCRIKEAGQDGAGVFRCVGGEVWEALHSGAVVEIAGGDAAEAAAADGDCGFGGRGGDAFAVAGAGSEAGDCGG